jgi:hypothetical protein
MFLPLESEKVIVIIGVIFGEDKECHPRTINSERTWAFSETAGVGYRGVRRGLLEDEVANPGEQLGVVLADLSRAGKVRCPAMSFARFGGQRFQAVSGAGHLGSIGSSVERGTEQKRAANN